MSGWNLSHVTANGVALAVHRRGRGPALVCLNAIGHDVHDFDALAERVEGRFSLVCIEWPGHGDSSNDAAPTSARRYAALLTAALDRLALEPPLIIGNSIGGAAAILYAARRPVRGLVLCDSGGLAEVTPLVRRVCGLFEGLFAGGARRAWWFGPAIALVYRQILPTRATAAQRRRIVGNCHRLAGKIAEGWASFGRPDADIRDVAAGLDAPIWAAWARSDRVIPYAVCAPAIARLRRSTTTLFAGGHSPFLEQPEAFAAGLLAFADGPAAWTPAAEAARPEACRAAGI